MVKEAEQKIKLPIVTERFLTVVLKVLSSKTDLTTRELFNIEKLVKTIDKNYYAEIDNTLDALIEAITVLVQFKLKNKQIDEEDSACILLEIQSKLSSSYYKEPFENIIRPIMNDSRNKKYPWDAEFINSEIYNHLAYGKVIAHKDEVVTQTNAISTASGKEMKSAIEKFQSLLTTFQEYFKEIDATNYSNQLIYSSENAFFDRMKENHDKSKNPSYVLKTGIQFFNQMLSIRNGVIPGLYIFYANINNFKSGILEYFAKWFHLYNYDTFKKIMKKTGKKPVILFISLENSQQEDFERFVKIYTFKDLYFYVKFTDVEDSWKKAVEEASGVSFEELNEVIEVVYWYPKNPIRVSDIMKMGETLEEQGYKLMAVITDYIEKIKSEIEDQKTRSDNYLLGKISDGLLQVSKRFDCAVITAGQINRSGASVLYNEKEMGKNNAVNNLNTTFIGKDFDIEKPATFSAFIDKELDKTTGKEYLSVKKAKQRGQRTKIETFSHEIIDGIILTDDIHMSKALSQLAITVPEQKQIAMHLSKNQITNGHRGRITLDETISTNKPSVKKADYISLKDAAAAVAKTVLNVALYYVQCKNANDFKISASNINSKSLIKNKGREYYISNKINKFNIC